MGLTTILTTILVCHRNRAKCKIRIFKETPTNSVCWRHAMSIFALVISRGSANLAFPCIWAKAVTA
jgi:hypothetical protein